MSGAEVWGAEVWEAEVWEAEVWGAGAWRWAGARPGVEARRALGAESDHKPTCVARWKRSAGIQRGTRAGRRLWRGEDRNEGRDQLQENERVSDPLDDGRWLRLSAVRPQVKCALQRGVWGQEQRHGHKRTCRGTLCRPTGR